ncbi:MAG: GDP-mannose 4,6-dehydratase [Gemmatimonadetes bacterium]|nr:GDP-mannose 4,6-dehydratase [Gemmatimonadota bacterium]
MRVLVTGADGFVGQHVVAALLAGGHEVTGGIRGDAPVLATLTTEEAARVTWSSFDLRVAASVRRMVRGAEPDAVLHLAGIASVSQSWREPETTFDVNATGSLRLLQALRALPARGSAAPAAARRPVLLVSSGEVYGADGTAEAPLLEDRPLRPVTPYGASKAAQEMIASVLADDAMRLIQTRSFQQIGPGQQPTFVTVNWARQLLDIRNGAQAPVLRVGNLEIDRDFLDVRDAAAAYVALLEDPRAEGVFNLCTGRACSLRHLLELLEDAVGVHPEIRVETERLRPAEIRSLVGSAAKLTAAIGWTPRHSLEDSVRTLVESLDHATRPA